MTKNLARILQLRYKVKTARFQYEQTEDRLKDLERLLVKYQSVLVRTKEKLKFDKSKLHSTEQALTKEEAND